MNHRASAEKKSRGLPDFSNPFCGATLLGMTDTKCTPQDREAIVRAAEQRAHYLQWIASKLLICDDKLIRQAAAEALMQMTGGVR